MIYLQAQPAVLVARLTCDCIQNVFGQWAEALDTDFVPMEHRSIEAGSERDAL